MVRTDPRITDRQTDRVTYVFDRQKKNGLINSELSDFSKSQILQNQFFALFLTLKIFSLKFPGLKKSLSVVNSW